MTRRRARSRAAFRTLAAALAISVSVSIAATTGGIAHAVVTSDHGSVAPTPLNSGEPNGTPSVASLARGAEQVTSAAVPTEPGTFVSLDPARILDTRAGNGAPLAPVESNDTVNVTVAGRGGVPESGVAAVVLNITVTSPARAGFVTAYPAGGAQPTASNLNFSAGQTIPNLATVKVGADGAISLTNNSTGRVDLIADVAGYYLAGEPTAPGAFVSLSPTRILDTREGNGAPSGPVAGGDAVQLQVTGRADVPETGVAAVVMNVTATESTVAGFVTVHPSGSTPPNTSSLNFSAGQNIPNLVTVRVGGDGKVNLRNYASGTVHLIADVAGYYRAGTPTAPGAFVSLDPARILDTREGNGAPNAAVPAMGTVSLQVADRGSVPRVDAAAVVMNVTASIPETGGFVTAYPYGRDQPTASNLNFTAGQNIPNLAAVKVGGNGRVDLTNNSAGTVELIADVAGYFLGSPDELDEVWPSGWIFDDCGTEWDGTLLHATPGIVYSPQGPVTFWEGEYYYDYYADGSGQVVVTATAEPGFVLVIPDGAEFVPNGDGSYTATLQFSAEPCS